MLQDSPVCSPIASWISTRGILARGSRDFSRTVYLETVPEMTRSDAPLRHGRDEEAAIPRVSLLLLPLCSTLTPRVDTRSSTRVRAFSGSPPMRGGDERGYRSGCIIVPTAESGLGPATRLTAAGHLDLDLDSARGSPRGEPRRENERMFSIGHFCILG